MYAGKGFEGDRGAVAEAGEAEAEGLAVRGGDAGGDVGEV